MDVAGRPSSPYLNKELFMFTPATSYINQFNSVLFSFNIDISSLVAGVYTIQAYNGIEYATKQIVKQ